MKLISFFAGGEELVFEFQPVGGLAAEFLRVFWISENRLDSFFKKDGVLGAFEEDKGVGLNDGF